MIISHIKPRNNKNTQWELQSNDEHSEQVANLASKFANEFGFSEYAKVIGLLHDKGKEQCGFQRYIKYVTGYDTALGYSPKTNHAYVGALIAQKLFSREYLMLSPVIIAHHRGLYDFSEFLEKMKCEIPQDVKFENFTANLKLDSSILQDTTGVNHIIRMLFSCLVDADRLDTESFMNRDRSLLRGSKYTLSDLLPKLEQYLTTLKESAKPTPLNIIRDKVQQICLNCADKPVGFYSMSVPTGGGKTLSSLLWAMHHAIKQNKKRIIIAIPYTSIIIQTAEVLRDIFGRDNVLEHHSALDDLEDREDSDSLKTKLATENWDSPIVITTNVQLFESIYSNKPSTCRKLHNICNSVLILDEVQSLPIENLQPIIDSLKIYNQLFGVSVLFTTASLPAFQKDILDKVFANSKGGEREVVNGFDDIVELIPRQMNLYKSLQRTELFFDNEEFSHEDIVKRLYSHNRVLCVVNSRKDALKIYSSFHDNENIYHLSRLMCSKHISSTIKEIKDRLKKDNTTPIKVISTQLIEAGVDIDFPVVYRQKAGLDSIVQAAGRCNREGSLDGLAPVYIFKLKDSKSYGLLSKAINSMDNMSSEIDYFSPESMNNYFIQLYSRATTFDKAKIGSYLHNSGLCFETASNNFRLIDERSRTIIVNYKDSAQLISQLKQEGINYKLMKKLYQYSVNLRESNFKQLLKSNLLEEILPNIYFLPDRDQYDKFVGLKTESHYLEELLIL